jgi:hypothetical protein
MKLEGVTPELFVTKGVESEYLPTLFEQIPRVVFNRIATVSIITSSSAFVIRR